MAKTFIALRVYRRAPIFGDPSGKLYDRFTFMLDGQEYAIMAESEKHGNEDNQRRAGIPVPKQEKRISRSSNS